jgi:hypothetical protein
MSTMSFIFYLSIGLERNQVHYYCYHLLAYCFSPGSYMVMTGAISGLNEWLGKPKYSEKTYTSNAAHQFQHDLIWVRTRATTVGSRQLTAWVMGRPYPFSYYRPHVVPTGKINKRYYVKICVYHGGDFGECRILDTKIQFVPHRKHMSPLQSPAG